MQKSQEWTDANLEVILEETRKEFPHGGAHSVRKKIAQKLLQSARRGNTTFSELSAVAHTMLSDLTKRR